VHWLDLDKDGVKMDGLIWKRMGKAPRRLRIGCSSDEKGNCLR
jgi:hypothetical protein